MNRKLRMAGIIIATVAFAVSIYLLLAPYIMPSSVVTSELPSWLSSIVLAVGLAGIFLFNLGNRQNKPIPSSGL